MEILNKENKMSRILCSTGAIIGRPNGRDITLLNSCQEQLECDGYEFLMYDTWYKELDYIRHFMLNFKAQIPVFHVEKTVGDLISRNEERDSEEAIELFRINCLLAKDLGAQKLVLHLWSGLDSDKNMQHNIEFYRLLREISDSYNLSLMIENVVCNFSDPMSHLLTLRNIYPDIQFTFDTKMAAFHSQIELLYEKENEDLFSNIKHIHVNDYSGGYKDWKKLNTLHIGAGHIDFDKFFDFLKRMNYQGDFTVEATSFDHNGIIDFDALNICFRKIRNYIA